MGVLDKLEASLADLFEKKAPAMPAGARKGLAGAMWVVALVFGVLQLWGAWMLWDLGEKVDRGVDYVNSLSGYFGTPDVASNLGMFFYLSLIFLAVEAALLLLATPGLKAMRKSGWNLLFYGLLLNVLYGVLRMFSEVGGGFGQFLWAVVVSAVGAYLLFQIRGQFTGKSASAEHPHSKPATHEKK
jgi:hypothetical protein